MSDYFIYNLRVAYSDTDAMGIVHHSNHIKYFEQARIDYLRQQNMKWHDHPGGSLIFAVRSLTTKYLKPARFDDELEVWTQGKLDGARVHFQYAIFSKSIHSLIALGTTELIALNSKLAPKRLPVDLVRAFKTKSWSEAWPPPLSPSET